ncbi:MAG: ABC transporter permease [Acidobacteriaceae bacterium]|nr:ABC transporter permease [Acidobacteriaceae bacterium]
MMRSFIIQREANLGLQPEKLVVSDVTLGNRYKTGEQQARFVRELTARLNDLPGVLSSSGDLDFPPFGGMDTDFELAGRTQSEKPKGQIGLIDAAFPRTVGVRLLRGRLLTEEDILAKRKVAVVNQAFVKKYYPGEDPIGKEIKPLRLERAPEPVTNPWFEIVGVVGDLKNHGTRDATVPEAYAPLTITGFGEYMIYVRTIGNPAPLAKVLEREILKLDKSVHPDQTMTFDAALELYEYAKPRFGLQIFAVFAGVGLILVTVGVYSVVSYTVSQQNREIGIRMALGANSGNVRRWVIFGGMRFVLVGVGVGIGAAFLILRLMKSQVVGISTYDPLTLLAVVVLLASVGVSACFLPSLRATRVDPLVSLRQE